MPAVMEQVNQMSTAEKLQKPRISDFIGYGARFHKLRTTEEWMRELREGEEE